MRLMESIASCARRDSSWGLREKVKHEGARGDFENKALPGLSGPRQE